MTSFIYMILATAMFFLQDTYFSFGSVAFSLKNPCAAAILGLALINFIVTVRMGRVIVLARHTLVQILPYVIPFLFSAVIWVVSGSDSVTIANGVGMIVPQLLSVAMAAATLYMFGSKGIWYCLWSMCMANFLRFLAVIVSGGAEAFLAEFRTLMVTFSTESGPLMEQLEINDLTFAFGPFMIYLFLEHKKIRHRLLWVLLVSFFFILGLKRIAIPAIALAVVAARLLYLLPEKAARQTALCVGVGMVMLSFLYVVGIRYGLFQYLEEKLQVDTKGRMEMFANLKPYYDISITYLGRGTGFERFVDWASGERFLTPQRNAMQIHNDFLRMYLNIGFAGYWVWIWNYMIVRLRYWFNQGGKNAGCLFFGICIYCFVLYATDNTIYYPYTMLACTLLPMASNLEALSERALEQGQKQWNW